MKKFTAILAGVLTVMTVVSGCGSGQTSAPAAPAASAAAETKAEAAAPAEVKAQVIKMAHTGSENTLMHKSFLVAKDYIESNSNGALTVEIYPNGQLGAEADLLQATQSGDIQMMATNNGYLVTLNPALEVFSVPFAFPSEDVAYKVLDSDFGQRMLDSMESTCGLKGLAYYESSDFRELTCKYAINSIDDLKGLKIRVMPNNIHVQIWENLGASPATISFGELYTALQQGTVDAQENPVELMLQSKFTEVQSYLIRTNHIFSNGMMVCNPAWYGKLSPELQQVVKEGAEAGQNYWREEAIANRTEYYKQAEEAGMTVIELDDATKAAMKDKVQPVVDVIAGNVGQEVVDELFKAVEENS